MNSSKFHDWLQIVGAAAIVASLIFVGLQLRQSQEIAVASQYQARYDSAVSRFNAIRESEVPLRIFGEFLKPNPALTHNRSEEFEKWLSEQSPEELASKWIFSYMQLKTFDNLHFQYQAGYLDEDSWQALSRDQIAGFGSSASFVAPRQIFESDPQRWRAPFRKMIEELIVEIDTQKD